jgi:hypothetical protein
MTYQARAKLLRSASLAIKRVKCFSDSRRQRFDDSVAKPKVEQKGDECGFRHNVRAEGTFRKISSRKPNFDDA